MRVIVSACLLGEACRYDGSSQEGLLPPALFAGCEVLPACPEVMGGLGTPRASSEIVPGRLVRVVDSEGADRTDAFALGARVVCDLAEESACTLAVLKAKSPSCGSGEVYDGTFSGRLVPGYGVAARALRRSGVRVVDERVAAACYEAALARGHVAPAIPLFAGSSSECPVLETERLVLRPLSPADEDDVFTWRSDPDLGWDAGWGPRRTHADMRFFIEQMASAPHVFGVFEKPASEVGVGAAFASEGADGAAPALTAQTRCIGAAGLSPDPARNNPDCLMLGYWLAKSAWGRGFMTEAAREVVRYGFEELGLSLISCTCYTFNDRSRRVIEKCGFSCEGVLRAADCVPDGRCCDVACYSLGRNRWEELARSEGISDEV